ncbi:MAG TPA: hypothetical protein VGO57_00865 [Verrucomicrobiae bacterium]|jgi:hypothetical protein
MKQLRTIHLYLGCIFAPMVIFFAISGLWQMFDLGASKKNENGSVALAYLSTIHTGHTPKSGTLSSPYMEGFVIAMAICLIFTILLGVVMAFRFGRTRNAFWCLLAGILAPILIVLLTFKR